MIEIGETPSIKPLASEIPAVAESPAKLVGAKVGSIIKRQQVAAANVLNELSLHQRQTLAGTWTVIDGVKVRVPESTRDDVEQRLDQELEREKAEKEKRPKGI